MRTNQRQRAIRTGAWLLLGCILPAAVLLGVAGSAGSSATLLLLALFLLCPLSMFWMARSGHRPPDGRESPSREEGGTEEPGAVPPGTRGEGNV
ncbi:MAG: hypothetical protein KY468_14175 [Armatimonadetes bacterium]|nr:hypothetical protein [Armatimonadota bacterium]